VNEAIRRLLGVHWNRARYLDRTGSPWTPERNYDFLVNWVEEEVAIIKSCDSCEGDYAEEWESVLREVTSLSPKQLQQLLSIQSTPTSSETEG
jgi:hypothetical protein